MQFLWFFLSVFLGIIGGYAVCRTVYLGLVNKASCLLLKKKEKEKSYGRKSGKA